jgi:outer membrane murein-binding lipoprotein Lpp
MKKLFPVVALLALVGSVLLAGCSNSEKEPAAPETPSTNAPAAQ